jgi:hypothetical protein
VVIRSLVTLGHLGRWLERNALAVDLLTTEAVSGFLADEEPASRSACEKACKWQPDETC